MLSQTFWMFTAGIRLKYHRTVRWSYQNRFRDGKHDDCATYLTKSIKKYNSKVEIEGKRKKADLSNDLFVKILLGILV